MIDNMTNRITPVLMNAKSVKKSHPGSPKTNQKQEEYLFSVVD
jgi:hypothetical protein